MQRSREAWGTETNFIGTGAYKLVSNDSTTEVVLEGFADYHEGKPGLDELRFVYIDDANTRILNYKNNDVDLVFILSLLSSSTKMMSLFPKRLSTTHLHPRSL